MNKDAVLEALGWIEKFQKDYESIQEKYADNAKLLKLYGGQLVREINTLCRNVFKHLGVETLHQSLEPGSFSLFGEQPGDKVRFKDLVEFVKNLDVTLNTAAAQIHGEKKPEGYLVSGFSDGSLHISVEPLPESRKEGADVISTVVKSVELLKSGKDVSENPVAVAAKKLLPRKNGHLQRIEVGGIGLQKETISKDESFSIRRLLRKQADRSPKQRTIRGRLTGFDGARKIALLGSLDPREEFSFNDNQAEELCVHLMKDEIGIDLERKNKRWILVRITPSHSPRK